MDLASTPLSCQKPLSSSNNPQVVIRWGLRTLLAPFRDFFPSLSLQAATRLADSKRAIVRPNRHWIPSSAIPTHDNLVAQKTRKKVDFLFALFFSPLSTSQLMR